MPKVLEKTLYEKKQCVDLHFSHKSQLKLYRKHPKVHFINDIPRRGILSFHLSGVYMYC